MTYHHKLDQEQFVEIPALRWRGGKTYMQVDEHGSPTGREVSICHAKPVHWEEQNEWREIDCAVKETETAFVASQNYWTATFFKDKPGAVVHRRGGLTLNAQLRALEAGSYREDVQSVEASVEPIPDPETGEAIEGYQEVVYAGAFEGVDVRYRNDNAFLKLEVEVSEAAKERILESADGDVELVFQANLSGATTEVDTEGGVVWLRGASDDPERLAPITLSDEEGLSLTQGRWAVSAGELKLVVPLEWLRSSHGAVKIDPNYYSTTSDGVIGTVGRSTWNDAHDDTDSNIAATTTLSNSIMVTARNASGGSSYDVYRAFFYFNTAGIPDGATINSASLHIYGEGTTYVGHTVCAMQGTQSDPLANDEMQAFSGNCYGVFEDTSGDGDQAWNGGKYNECNIDGSTDCPGGEACDDGRNDIVDTGITKICCREYDHDYKDVAPSAGHRYQSNCYWADQTGTTKDPYLEIDHSPLSTSTSTTTTTSSSTSTSSSTTSISTSTTTSSSSSTSTSITTTSTSTTSTSITTTSTSTTSTSISTTSISATTLSTSTSTSITTTSTSTTTTSTSTTSTSITITTTSTSITTTSTSTTTSVTTMSTTTVRPECMAPVCNPEADQILVPEKDGMVHYNLMNLFGFSSRKRRSISGAGHGPLHFITQRGPYQDGETPVGIRYDPRTLQVVVAERLGGDQVFWERRNDVIDMLRPNRAFMGPTDPLIYRRWLPGGDLVYGNDLETLAGSALVTCNSGKFVHSGLRVGKPFFILTDYGGTSPSNHGEYEVAEVLNDYTIRLNADLSVTATDQNWMYRRSWSYRDLYCLLEEGPAFDQGPDAQPFYPTGYQEVLRFVAHDPFWYGEVQEQDWNLLLSAGNYGDLVFDGEGAWLGAVPGVGRWVFIPGTVAGETGTIDVVYWGTAPALPTFYLNGPIGNFLVTNETSGDYIFLDYTATVTETITIDVKTHSAINDAGDILTQYIEGDLATFGIYPPPEAPRSRKNVISVSFNVAEAGTSNVRMEWRNTYAGI